MLFQNKNLKTFKRLLKEIYADIKNKEFTKAVAKYEKLESTFKGIPQTKLAEKIKNDMDVLHKEMLLYLRINEAYTLAELGDLNKLREELDIVRESFLDKQQESAEIKPLSDYVKKNFAYCLKVYDDKVTKRKFNSEYQSVKKLADNKNTQKALKEYSKLLIAYHKLKKYLSDQEQHDYYSKLKELYKNISLQKFIDTQSKRLAPATIKSTGLPKHIAKKKYKLDDAYHKLRLLIKKGEISEASSLLKEL